MKSFLFIVIMFAMLIWYGKEKVTFDKSFWLRLIVSVAVIYLVAFLGAVLILAISKM